MSRCSADRVILRGSNTAATPRTCGAANPNSPTGISSFENLLANIISCGYCFVLGGGVHHLLRERLRDLPALLASPYPENQSPHHGHQVPSAQTSNPTGCTASSTITSTRVWAVCVCVCVCVTEVTNFLQSPSLQTSKLHVSFRSAQEQCVELQGMGFHGEQLHPSLTSPSAVQSVERSGVKLRPWTLEQWRRVLWSDQSRFSVW
ncbi:hypothetical protein NFI96_018149 [Prochilodus magdalenae]|nr:hypothetical protein NFI96_018149 [Prochilodus magdalenae]